MKVNAAAWILFVILQVMISQSCRMNSDSSESVNTKPSSAVSEHTSATENSDHPADRNSVHLASVSPVPFNRKTVFNPMNEIETLLTQQIEKERFFSAAQIMVFKNGKPVFEKHTGTVSFYNRTPITSDTMFDLASLTKPLCILPMYAYYIHIGMIAPDAPISTYLPKIKKNITIKKLLSHQSGLPAYYTFFWKCKDRKTYAERKQAVIEYAANYPKEHPPVYSDINYMLLGFILEEVFGKRLDVIYNEFLHTIGYQISAPAFTPSDKSCVVATSYSGWRKVNVHGNVEDENAYYLGEIAGHAGMFASAQTVGAYLSFLMTQPWFRLFLEDGIGFDIPDPENSAYGKCPKHSYRGHLGYTGTAFLIDTETDTVAVVLTNRTHPNDTKYKGKERIKEVRQALFDLLMTI